MVLVVLNGQVRKDLARIPKHIAEKARLWIEELREEGLQYAQANARWRDEGKQGKLKSVRAIWLSREYRLFYEVKDDTSVIVSVLEINRHD